MKRVLLALLALGLLSACDTRAQYLIQYSVTGLPASANLTYQDENGSPITKPGESLMWEYSFIGVPGDAVSLQAENATAGGNVQVNIFVDGSLIWTAASDPTRPVVQVSAVLPENHLYW